MALPKDPTAFNKPSQRILNESDIDGLGRALLTLAQEVWTVKDRMSILEAVLDKHGIDASAEIEAFQPDAALQEKLNADGAALVENLLKAMTDS